MNTISIKTQILLSILFVEAIFIALDFLGFQRSFWLVLFDIGLGVSIAYIISKIIASSIESLTKKSIQFSSDNSVSFDGFDGSTEVCELSTGLEQMRKQIVSKNKLISSQLEKIDEYIITSTTDANGKIVDVSRAYCMICGYSKDELIGNSHNIVRHPDNSKEFFEHLWSCIKRGEPWHGEIKNRSKDTQTYWLDTTINPIKDDSDKIVAYYSISHDITAKKLAEEQALTDTLTTLGNRRKLDADFDELIKIYARYKMPFSIIIADIDKFKSVNDTYGHEIGDTVLKRFAKILKENTRVTDKVGRWGGEEFMVLCHNTNAEEAVALAQKLKSEISNANFAVVGKITASFGVSTFGEGDDVASSTKRADDALYRAKESGRNRVEFE
jgi:diguanylate cyclase (GGDEF)-like protein/PAS domain S-box-containing protein